MKRIFTLFCCFNLLQTLTAQTVSFDPTFNGGLPKYLNNLNEHFKILVIDNENYYANSSYQDNMGSGTEDPYVDLVSNNPSGSATNAFYFNFITGDLVTDIDFASNGQLLVVGRNNDFNSIYFARMSASNVVDANFNNGNVKTYYDPNYSYEPQIIRGLSDGKIIIAGKIDNLSFFVMRFNSNGTIDNTFGTNGEVVFDAYSSNTAPTLTDMIVLSDGKMLVSGNQFLSTSSCPRAFVGRLNADGTPDNTFGTNGFTTLNFGSATLTNIVKDIDLTASGDIIAAGWGRMISGGFNRSIAHVAKLNSAGALVTSFGTSGIYNADSYFSNQRSGFNAVSVMANGDIAVAGGYGPAMNTLNDGVFVFLNDDGTVDQNYASNGMFTVGQINMYNSVSNFKIQPDGKIVYFVSGLDMVYESALGRLNIQMLPEITASSSNLNTFTQTIGAPSAEQTFTVSGSSLTSDITVSSPANYEVSLTSGTGFASSVQLTQTAGTVSSTTVYLRLNASVAGSYNGNVTLTSGSLTEVIAITGTAIGTNALSENSANNFVIYPNPAQNLIQVKSEMADHFEIRNMQGRIVYEGNISGETTIDIQHLAAGVYMIETSNGSVQRFIKE